MSFTALKHKERNRDRTSLKAFSHQRRAKPFNTLRSKADPFEKSLFEPKSHFKFDTSIFRQKAVSAEKPLEPKCLIKFDPFWTDLIEKNPK